MKHTRFIACAALVGMLATACGGTTHKGSSTAKATVPEGSTPTTTPADLVTEPSASGSSSTSTTQASPAGGVSTTVKRTTVTTAKKAFITPAAKAVTAGPTGGIGNVTSETTVPNDAVQPGGTATVLKSTESPGFDPVQMN